MSSVTPGDRPVEAKNRASRAHTPSKQVCERDIEAALVEQVEAAGGKIRKVRWLGRDGAPDRRVLGIGWVEVKRPGGVLSPRQVREIDEMRRCGERVEVISTFKEVDDFVRSVIW